MRAVQCPFCFICLDVTRVPVGNFIKCPACSGPIRVPQPDRRKPIARLAAGVAGGLAVGVLLTVAYYRVTDKPAAPMVSSAAPRPPAQPTEASGPPPEPAVNPTGRGTLWEEQVDKVSQMLRREFPGIHLQPARPWLLALEPGDYSMVDVIPLYERALKSLEAAFAEEFKELPLSEIRRPLTVLILRNRAAFKFYWLRNFSDRNLPDNVPGVYQVGFGTVTYHDNHLPFERLLHEGTHQLVHAFSKEPPQTFWFHEGLGNFFETYLRVKNERFETVHCTPSINLPRRNDARDGLNDETLQNDLRLSNVLGMTLGDFDLWYNNPRASDEGTRRRATDSLYGVSWAVVYFMLRSGNADYRAAFLEYLQEELQGRGGRLLFEEILDRRAHKTPDEFERELRSFIEYIR